MIGQSNFIRRLCAQRRLQYYAPKSLYLTCTVMFIPIAKYSIGKDMENRFK